ncbi:hypothetical protein [Streptomyces sp. NPDC087437]|uniref:hypothetical protein n=1 Tax=Streptomyces sp. NPDC087437 TaxID=3365789 RepID=UPI0038192AC1
MPLSPAALNFLASSWSASVADQQRDDGGPVGRGAVGGQLEQEGQAGCLGWYTLPWWWTAL